MNKKLRTIKEILEGAHNQDYACNIVDFISFDEKFRYYENEKRLCMYKTLYKTYDIVTIPLTIQEIKLLDAFIKKSKIICFKKIRKDLLTL